MKQNYSKYTKEDKSIWQLLFSEQEKNLNGKSCKAYLQSIDELKKELNADTIVNFEQLNKKLKKKNGWSVIVVPGLIPVEDFFRLIKNKKFPSSTWLRTKEQLDYLEEPDMFHDIFGHVPLLMNKDYSNFMEKFGEVGCYYQGKPDAIKKLQTLYWFTIEFGLLREEKNFSIYGAGILSSNKETKHVFEKPIRVLPFDINVIVNTPYDISDIQEVYFQIDSFKQLYESLENIGEHLTITD